MKKKFELNIIKCFINSNFIINILLINNSRKSKSKIYK